jgi:hypothetical protein
MESVKAWQSHASPAKEDHQPYHPNTREKSCGPIGRKEEWPPALAGLCAAVPVNPE